MQVKKGNENANPTSCSILLQKGKCMLKFLYISAKHKR